MTEYWSQKLSAFSDNLALASRFETRFDLQKLKAELKQVQSSLEPIYQIPQWGGWSLMSASGHHHDGWQKGQPCFTTSKGATELDKGKFEALGAKPSRYHVNPTEAMKPYCATVIQYFRDAGLNPTKARIVELKAHRETSVHRDATDDDFFVRVHIPIETNDHCYFVTEEGRVHMPADGSAFLVRVNRLHKAVNFGATDRYHLMIDVVVPDDKQSEFL